MKRGNNKNIKTRPFSSGNDSSSKIGTKVQSA